MYSAIIIYCIVAIVGTTLKIERSTYEILQVLGISLLDSELFEPKKVLENIGAEVTVISPEGGNIKAWNHGNWSKEIKVDVTLDNASENNYDCLILPNGVINPDKLRRIFRMQE